MNYILWGFGNGSKTQLAAAPLFLPKRGTALTRAEIDNTLQIIELIEDREEQMLIVAPHEDLEDIFLLSPQLVQQLRKKINIMLDHQLDGKRLFVSPNK